MQMTRVISTFCPNMVIVQTGPWPATARYRQRW